MSFEVLSASISAAVATSGTITFTYPTGRSQGMYLPGAEKLRVPSARTVYNVGIDFQIVYNSTTVVITWLNALTIPALQTLQLELRLNDELVFDQINPMTGIIPADRDLYQPLFNFRVNSLPKWRKSLANVRRGLSNAVIAFVGDSTTRGQGSATTTGQALNGFPVQLSNLLNATPGLKSGWQNIFGQANTTITTFDSRIALTGTFTTASVCFGASPFRMGAAATMAFTPTVNCDTFDIYSINNGTGQFTINLDGGATLATVNTTTNGAIVKTTVSGTLAAHTLNCVWVSGATFVLGIDAYDSATKQVSCWNGGWLASTAANWNSQVGLFAPMLALRDYLVPDLTIIDLGINNWSASADPTQFKSDMSNMLSIIRPTLDVVLKTPIPTQATSVSLDTQRKFIQATYELAEAYDCPLVDCFTRWGSYEEANPLGFYNDNKHGSAIGYNDIASALHRAIVF